MTIIEPEGGTTDVFIRGADDARYVRIDSGFPASAKIVDVVAANGAPWVVCLARVPPVRLANTPIARTYSCGAVSLAGEMSRTLELDADADHRLRWITCLLGPSEISGCFLCIVATARDDGKLPPQHLFVDYSVARVNVVTLETNVLDSNVGARF